MRILRRDLDELLELGPLAVVSVSLDDLQDPQLRDVSREKRGVDPLSIPRLIKEPPLKKRSDFKRGDVVYPSAAKQTVPLVRVREPPLKRGQRESEARLVGGVIRLVSVFLEEILQFNDANKRFLDPVRRLR